MFAQPIALVDSFKYPEIIRPHTAHLGIKADYIHTIPHTIQDMYGNSNLGEFPMFAGGYINFGFWEGINLAPRIPTDSRVKSSENLYHYLCKRAHLNYNSEVLEVGCGVGLGCRLMREKYKVGSIIGLDNNIAQIERSKKQNPGIPFIQGAAEKIPFPSNSFSHLISLEAAQHFQSVPHFLSEALRVLKPQGKLIFATFFPRDEMCVKKLFHVIPDFDVHLTRFTAIDVFKECLNQNFHLLQIESIGDFVWRGLDAWLDQDAMLKHQWSRLWYTAYQNKLLDYYVVQAEKLSIEAQLKLQLCAKL